MNAHITRCVAYADSKHAWHSEAVQEYSEHMEEGKKLMSGLVSRRNAFLTCLLASCMMHDPSRGKAPPSAMLRKC